MISEIIHTSLSCTSWWLAIGWPPNWIRSLEYSSAGVVAIHGGAKPAPGDAVASLVEAHQRVLQTFGFGQDVVGGDPAVLEAQLRCHRGTERELAVLVARGEPGCALFDQESAHAVFGLGPNHRDVGQGAVGDPLLGPVQDPLVAVAAGGGEHAAGVGAEIGLGQAKAADRLARCQGRDPAVALLLGAEGVDRIHHQGALDGNKAPQARVAPLELLHGEAVGDAAEARQSVFVDAGAEQVELRHLGHKLDRAAPFPVALLDDRRDPFVHE